MQFWIAADPVTTVEDFRGISDGFRMDCWTSLIFMLGDFLWVIRYNMIQHDTTECSQELQPTSESLRVLQDPSKREADTLIDSPWDEFDLSPGGTRTFTRGITEPCGDHIHKALRLVKSSEHIHTVDEDGDQSATPMHNYAARSPPKAHSFIASLRSNKAEHLPTKEWDIMGHPGMVGCGMVCLRKRSDMNGQGHLPSNAGKQRLCLLYVMGLGEERIYLFMNWVCTRAEH